jgi:hypothetical protein
VYNQHDAGTARQPTLGELKGGYALPQLDNKLITSVPALIEHEASSSREKQASGVAFT